MLSKYFKTSRAYLIGIQNYDNVALLSTPHNDIDKIAKCLEMHEFLSSNITILKDDSKTQIEHLLERMQTDIEFNDRVVFYFAGHGIAHDSEGSPKGYLIPKEGKRTDENSFVDMEWLSKKILRLRCRHFLMILDCCFAGSFRWAGQHRALGLDQTQKLYLQKFLRFVSGKADAWHVIASCSHDEEAIDKLLNLGGRENGGLQNDNSPFASIFIAALSTGAEQAFPDGVITASRLYNFIDTELANFLFVNQIKRDNCRVFSPWRGIQKVNLFFWCRVKLQICLKNYLIWMEEIHIGVYALLK